MKAKIEMKKCAVCTKRYKTDAVIIGPRTEMGWGICPSHAAMLQRGLVAVVEIDPERSNLPERGEELHPAQVWRTGTVAFISRLIWGNVFDVDVPSNGIVFIEPLGMAMLQKMDNKRADN